jgi:hypothetical protein
VVNEKWVMNKKKIKAKTKESQVKRRMGVNNEEEEGRRRK